MRIVVAGLDGASGPVGRGLADRLVRLGHDVIGVGRRRPESWPGSVVFIELDPADETDDGATLAHVFVGADAAVDCGTGTSVFASTAADSGVGRIVVHETPGLSGGTDVPGAVTIRTPLVLGRNVDDVLIRRFTAPVVVDSAPDAPLQVVHPEDVARVFVQVLTDEVPAGDVDVASAGHTSIRAIAAAVGRRALRTPWQAAPTAPRTLAPHPLHAWDAADCVADFALACRGRITLGSNMISFPWRLPRVREIPAADAPSADGVKPEPAGPANGNGEFDTPVDPRFPAFIATNLSEALPGPFTPSSASVSVRGTRAAGLVIAGRLRPGGAVEREMSVRTTGVFGHRLYAGLTSGHFMAQTVPLVNPDMILDGFFGRTAEGLDLFGSERPPVESQSVASRLRAVGTFANNLLVLSAGSKLDSRNFIADVARLEELAADPTTLDDRRLRAVTLLGRDHAVHGWVLASASILVCTAYGVILRILCGRDVLPAAGPQLASAQSLAAVHRLVAAAHDDPAAERLLAGSDVTIEALAEHAPRFAAALYRELALIGHRGPGEVELYSTSYADDPELLVSIVAKAASLDRPRDVPKPPHIPLWVRPVALAAAAQLREREVRRDRMVRAIWVVRTLLREHGRRLVESGALEQVDDVFYLQVDELDALPPDVADVVARRREQRRTLAETVPPEAFSGHWEPVPTASVALAEGESLEGMGVGGGVGRGRVRVVHPGTIGDLQPGDVLVAKVTDVGYTPAFAYAAAVVTELGGPISHAAIVAREFGMPCVVNARGASTRLPEGALVEVDGASGRVTLLGS